MTRYIEFPLEGGGTILIESPDEPPKGPSGFTRSTGAETSKENAEQAAHSFDESIENIRRSADLLVSKLRDLSQPPDEMEVNFSLKASGDVGNMAVAKNGGDANFRIILRWRKEKEKDKDKEPKSEKDEDK